MSSPPPLTPPANPQDTLVIVALIEYPVVGARTVYLGPFYVHAGDPRAMSGRPFELFGPCSGDDGAAIADDVVGSVRLRCAWQWDGPPSPLAFPTATDRALLASSPSPSPSPSPARRGRGSSSGGGGSKPQQQAPLQVDPSPGTSRSSGSSAGRSLLRLVIVGCSGLVKRSRPSKECRNVFVEIENTATASKVRTASVARTAFPVFEHACTISVRSTGDRLRARVLDREVIGRVRCIGAVDIPWAARGFACGKEHVLELTDRGGEKCGVLQVILEREGRVY